MRKKVTESDDKMRKNVTESNDEMRKNMTRSGFLDAEREVLTLILRKYAFSYISTSFTSACSSDNNASKSPKVSQTVAVLSFG